MITDRYRVGQRCGQGQWLVKEAPGWHVVHRADNLSQCANWLALKGVDLTKVSVLDRYPWRSLAEHMEELGSEH